MVGMTTKLLSIKCRPQRKDDTPSNMIPRGGTYRYFVRGKSYKPASVSVCVKLNVYVCLSLCVNALSVCVSLCMQEEYLVNMPKKKRLQPYEKFLKKFKYKSALDAALEVSSAIE